MPCCKGSLLFLIFFPKMNDVLFCFVLFPWLSTYLLLVESQALHHIALAQKHQMLHQSCAPDSSVPGASDLAWSAVHAWGTAVILGTSFTFVLGTHFVSDVCSPTSSFSYFPFLGIFPCFCEVPPPVSF